MFFGTKTVLLLWLEFVYTTVNPKEWCCGVFGFIAGICFFAAMIAGHYNAGVHSKLGLQSRILGLQVRAHDHAMTIYSHCQLQQGIPSLVLVLGCGRRTDTP